MLTKYLWPLLVSAILAVVGGLLIVAPFALQYQPFGASWTTATETTLWDGIGLAVIALATGAVWLGALRDAVGSLAGEDRRAARRASHAAEDAAARPVPAQVTAQARGAQGPAAAAAVSDEVLATLAAAVLRDLQERTGQKSWKEGA